MALAWDYFVSFFLFTTVLPPKSWVSWLVLLAGLAWCWVHCVGNGLLGSQAAGTNALRKTVVGKDAKRLLPAPSRRLAGQELLYFAWSVLLWIFEIVAAPVLKCKSQHALQRQAGQVPPSPKDHSCTNINIGIMRATVSIWNVLVPHFLSGFHACPFRSNTLPIVRAGFEALWFWTVVVGG